MAWGERGHIYTRRVWGTSPSIVFQQADVGTVGGWTEVSADQPDIAVGGNSSWVGRIGPVNRSQRFSRPTTPKPECRDHSGGWVGTIGPLWSAHAGPHG